LHEQSRDSDLDIHLQLTCTACFDNIDVTLSLLLQPTRKFSA
jgi:hypothetical protein